MYTDTYPPPLASAAGYYFVAAPPFLFRLKLANYHLRLAQGSSMNGGQKLKLA